MNRKIGYLFLLCVISCLLWCNHTKIVKAEEVPKQAEYLPQYEAAEKLADYLKDDPYLLYNKTYSKEQEEDLKNLVESVCGDAVNDRDRAETLLAYIRGYMEVGSAHDLGTWDMLCDGESLQKDGENKKKVGRKDNFCFAFYDLCRLQNIPCFMIEDSRESYIGNYICMVYLEENYATTPTDEGRNWYFVDVADSDGKLVTKDQAYATFGADFFPLNLSLDYDENCAVNEIHLDKESMILYSDCVSKGRPKLAYDAKDNVVKTYINENTLADGESYYSTTSKVGANGEAPSGWMQTEKYKAKDNKTREKITYVSYAVHGVFLRGRVSDGKQEYDLQADWNSIIPFYCEIGKIDESEEHAAKDSQTRKFLQNQAKKIAESLYQDENFIFDTNFTEKEEAYLRNALSEALSWDYIQSKKSYFDMYGIELGEEGDPLSDRAKAQAICFYIRDHVKYGGAVYVNSISVLETGYAICGGYTLLFRDLCVMADIPCFMLRCSTSGENIEGQVFSDHGNNLLKVDGEWIFADPTGIPKIDAGGWYPTAFLFGYSTSFQQTIYIDFDYLRKEYYGKWLGAYICNKFYEFDSEGELGIYCRDRKRNPVRIDRGVDATDEKGKMCIPNGLYMVDAAGDTENGTKVEEWRYAYYVQQGEMLEGRTHIKGKEYLFDTTVYKDGNHYFCQKMERLLEKYYIAKLNIGVVDDQVYTGKDICPVPVIYHDEKKLEYGKDFLLSYEGNKEITRDQETRFIVEGIGQYTGTVIRPFKIIKRDITDMDVSLAQTEYTWDMTSDKAYGYRPKVTVELDPLDYVVYYYDCTDVGRAKVVIIARNHCTGSITRYYDIKPCKIDAKHFKIDGTDLQPWEDSYEYNFRKTEPDVAVNWYESDGTPYRSLRENYECKVTYTNSDKVGTATITIEGIGKFEGTLSCTYEITPYNIRNSSGLKQSINWGSTVESDVPRAYYTGEPLIPELPGITYVTENTPSLGNLKRDVDFTVTTTDNVHVGMGTLVIQGIGCCTGKLERPFRILPRAIKKDDISIEAETIAYDGTVKKPVVTILGLTEGKEYQLTYEKRENGDYIETDPIEGGSYVATVHLISDDVEYHYNLSGVDSNDNTCYRIPFTIKRENGSTGVIPSASPSPSAPPSPSSSPSSAAPSSVATLSPTKAPGKDLENGYGSGEPVSSEGTGGKSEDNSYNVGRDELEKINKATTLTPMQVKNLKVSVKKQTMLLRWGKVKSAINYQLQVCLRKDFKKAKNIKISKSKTSYQVKKLKKKQTYYVRIRAYEKSGNKKAYGNWSKVKKVRIK